MVSSLKGVAGSRGVGDKYILEVAAHKSGGGCPLLGNERFEKKHVVVVCDWLLLLNVIVSLRIIIVEAADRLNCRFV